MNASSLITNVTDMCIILGVNTTVPWDNPNNLISLETELIIDRIKAAVLAPLLFLIGAPANMVNMLVFFRQGLKERISLCLFSLALADLVALTLGLGLYAERIYTQFTDGEKYGEFYRLMMNKNVMGLYGFGYVPTFLAAVIATERCICVLFPLQAQRCIPTKALAALIIVSTCVLVFTRFAITAQYYVACFFEMRTGRKSWQVFVNEYHFQNSHILRPLDGVMYGFGVAVGGPMVVLITTVITAVKLQQIIRWRSETSSGLSSKEILVTKMLICLSTECFILAVPVIVLRILPVFEPHFSNNGYFANTFTTLVSLAEVCAFTSSSVNFFVYYFTGSRFRATLKTLLDRKSTKG